MAFLGLDNVQFEVNHAIDLPPVQNQQLLGNCLYLSAAELTGIVYSRGDGNGVYTHLSAQDLLDNVRNMYPDRYTMHPGSSWAYDYHVAAYIRHTGLCTEAEYPFVGIRNPHPPPLPMAQRYAFRRHSLFLKRILPDGQDDPVSALRVLHHLGRNPIVGFLYVAPAFFNLQPGAVFRGEGAGQFPGPGLNHAVIIVASGSVVVDGEVVLVFLIKNTYGTIWANQGYGLVERTLVFKFLVITRVEIIAPPQP